MEPCGTLWNLVEPCGAFWNPCGILAEIFCETSGPPRTIQNPHGTLPQTTTAAGFHHGRTLANPRGTLPPSIRRTWWKFGGTMVEPSLEPYPGGPSSNHAGPPRSRRSNWWNPGGIWWNPRGTCVDSSNHAGPQHWWNPGQTLVEVWWNPGNTRTTPQPLQNLAALAEPGGNLVEPWWRPGGTLVEPWWNPGGTWWNPRETLPQPRTTPQPSQNLVEPGGTLVEPLWPYLKPPGTTPQPSKKLVEVVGPWWNSRGTLPQGRPGPPRSLSGMRPQSFQLLGKKEHNKEGKHTINENNTKKKTRPI